MRDKLFSTIITGLFVVVCGVALVKSLSTPVPIGDAKMRERLESEQLKKNAIILQHKRDYLQLTELNVAIEEALTEQQKAIQERENLPNVARRNALIWVVVFVTACINSAIFTIGLVVSLVKIAVSDGAALVRSLTMLRPVHPSQFKMMEQQLRLEREREKRLALTPGQEQLIIDAQGADDLKELKTTVPTAAECLDLQLISKTGDRFLYGFDETGTPKHGNLVEANTGIAIIGVSQQGKTWNAASITAQHIHKGFQAVIIDPFHASHPKSLTQYLNPFSANPGVMWCDEKEKVLETFDFVVKTLEARLAGGEHPRMIIVADECLRIAATFKTAFEESILRVVTEGAKAGIYFVAISHSWKGTRHTTELRDNISICLSHKITANQSNRLFGDKEVANQTAYLDKGAFILRDEALDVSTLTVPIWDRGTMERMSKESPQHPLRTEVPKVEEKPFIPHLVGGKRRKLSGW